MCWIIVEQSTKTPEMLGKHRGKLWTACSGSLKAPLSIGKGNKHKPALVNQGVNHVAWAHRARRDTQVYPRVIQQSDPVGVTAKRRQMGQGLLG